MVERTERELTPEEQAEYEERVKEEENVPDESRNTNQRNDSAHDDIKICKYES